MKYNPVEYWNERIKNVGFVNSSKTAISRIEALFVESNIGMFDKVLDYGVGDGKLFGIYEKYQNIVTGYDIADFQNLITENLKNKTFEYNHIISNSIRELTEFEEKQFDLCCCISVMQHVLPEHIEMIFKDIKRISNKAIFTIYENTENRNIKLDVHCYNHNVLGICKKAEINVLSYENKNNITFLVI